MKIRPLDWLFIVVFGIIGLVKLIISFFLKIIKRKETKSKFGLRSSLSKYKRRE